MLIFLVLLFSNVALDLADDLNIGESTVYVAPQGPDNIIEEAVKLMQIEYIDRLISEKENLQQQNKRTNQELLEVKQKYKTSQDIIAEMTINHEAEITRMKEKYDEEIKGIQEEHENEVIENERECARKLNAKDTLTQYILGVLKDSDSLIKFWQNLVKVQAQEMSKFEKFYEMEKIVHEKQKIIEAQSENIKDLEEIIKNNNNLTALYEKLVKLDPTKSNCQIPMWMTTLTEALASQQKEITTLTGYLDDKKDIEEHMRTLTNLEGNTKMTEMIDTCKLSRNFELTMDKQSDSINLLRDILTNSNNSSCGLKYDEEDGRTALVTPCSCIPTPPQDTGLQLANIQFVCKDKNNSQYKVHCNDAQCETDAWPSCPTDDEEMIEQASDVPWTYYNCKQVDIPYMNTSVDCGSHGWKDKKIRTNVSNGVYESSIHVPCKDCDELTFQWTKWEKDGNNFVRSRGARIVSNSFQQEEVVAELLYEAEGLSYFKVLVSHGVQLDEGSVPDTCEKNGMKAVCFGAAGCEHNSKRCMLTPLAPSSCGDGNVNTISKLICNGKTATRCPKTKNMFISMNNWNDHSECGNVDGSHCVKGKNFVSNHKHPYYAFCVL